MTEKFDAAGDGPAYRAFVAFSGGGAKGIVHVGALKALEQRKIDILGVAGTSAGSIVATLIAAGFTADDLIDTKTGHSIFSLLAEIDPNISKVTDLFGGGGWHRIRFLRWLFSVDLGLGPAFLTGWLFLTFLMVWILVYFPSTWLWLSIVGWVGLGISLFVVYRFLVGGLADVSAFRCALATLLQRKLFPGEPDRVVTMDDFGHSGRPALKIVSANLTARRLHLFSAERTPDTPAADAVAASICLPMIFKPWRIGDDVYVDGGIVSNLPAWPFDEEREMDPEALTITVEIDAGADRGVTSEANWLPAAINTTLWGSGELNVRIAGPSERLVLPTRLNLLDFDVTGEAARAAVDEVAAAVAIRLDKRLLTLPALYRDACEVVRSVAEDGLGLNGQDKRVRVAVGRLDRGYRKSLRLLHGVGFERDPDEGMLIPVDGSVAGAAWTEGDSRLEVYPLSPDLDLPGSANRLRRKSRWPDLAWVMCIPILDGNGLPRFVVQIDSNAALVDTEDTQSALANVEGAVKDFFGLILDRLVDLEDDAGVQK